MTPLYAFDGALAFDLNLAKSHGGILCTTYIRGYPGGMPPANAARVNDIRAHGMGASPNWEATADFFGTCTIAQAEWAGADALAYCRSCGYPDDGSIACSFSFDFDVPAGRYAEMGRKVMAIAFGLGGHYQVMIYGQESLIVYLVEHGYVMGKHWLMMSTFGQAYDPGALYFCMVQGHDINGNWIQDKKILGTDINTVTDPYAVYAWWPAGSPYALGGTEMLDPTDPVIVKMTATIENLRQMLVQVIGEPTHPASPSLRNIMAQTNVLPTSVELAEMIANIPGLTAEQVQEIASIIAEAMPLGTQFDLSGTLTRNSPVPPPTPPIAP
jgi:hypothetical protein